MVKAKRKPLNEIKAAIKDYKKILNIGCGGCVSICLAGGQKEVGELNLELNMAFALDRLPNRLDGYTVERQCNMKYLEELDEKVGDYDCLLSMACGAGVQMLAERFQDIPVFPALDTIAIGVDRDIGLSEERCRACGHCVLAYTAGICPITRCSKQILNGPCGGTQKGGICEVSGPGEEIACAWHEIYTRLKQQNRLDNILKMQPIMEWRNKTQPLIVQEPYEKHYYRD